MLYSQRFAHILDKSCLNKCVSGMGTTKEAPIGHRLTLETLQVQFQMTATQQISQQSKSNKAFGFIVHVKAIFTFYYSLLSVQIPLYIKTRYRLN